MNPVLAEQHAHYSAIRSRINSGRFAQIPERVFEPPDEPMDLSPQVFRVQHNWHVLAYARHLEGFRPFPTVHEIVRAVAKNTGVDVVDILSVRRKAPLVEARHLAMWIARYHTTYSFPQIARRLGGREHTTVFHGAAKMSKRLETSQRLCDLVRHICIDLGMSE